MTDRSCHYGLALHTTSPELGLAIDNFVGDRRSQVLPLGRDLSNQLHERLAEFLQPQRWTDLKFIAAIAGPGSFTGTRIGLVVARTLAQQLEIPLYAISGLAVLAYAHQASQAVDVQKSKNRAKDIAVQMQARRQQVFAAIYAVNSADKASNFAAVDAASATGGESSLVTAESASESAPDSQTKALMVGSNLQPLLADTTLLETTWQETLATWPRPYHLLSYYEEDRVAGTVTQALAIAERAWQQGMRPHWSTALPFYGQHPVRDNAR